MTPGGKAAAGGLLAGDFILAINGTSWEGLKHMEAQQLVTSATDHVVLKWLVLCWGEAVCMNAFMHVSCMNALLCVVCMYV